MGLKNVFWPISIDPPAPGDHGATPTLPQGGEGVKLVRFSKFFFLSGRELNSWKGAIKKFDPPPFLGGGWAKIAQNSPFGPPTPQKGGWVEFFNCPFPRI